jgi:uncharacterized Tic20 family protein
MAFKYQRTYTVIIFMLVFIVSGILSFVQSTDLSFINDLSIVQKMFAVCLSIFILFILYIITYGAIHISEDLW